MFKKTITILLNSLQDVLLPSAPTKICFTASAVANVG